MVGQQIFRQWLGVVRHQAITWTSVDQDIARHMTSLGHNELINTFKIMDPQVGFKLNQVTGDGKRLISIAARMKEAYQGQGLMDLMNQECLRLSLEKRPGVVARAYCTQNYPVTQAALKKGTEHGTQVVWKWVMLWWCDQGFKSIYLTKCYMHIDWTPFIFVWIKQTQLLSMRNKISTLYSGW